MEGLRCEGATGSKTCQPLHLAVTASVNSGAGPIEAVAVRAEAGAAPFELSEAAGASRFPRWSKDGTAVAFVQEETAGSPVLVSRTIPLATGQKTELTTGTAAATEDFRHMEWEPSSRVAWTKKAGTSVTGISVLAPPSTTVETASPNGGFPSWKDDQSLFYSAAGSGVLAVTLGGTPADVGGSSGGEQPRYNRVTDFLLYLASTGTTNFADGSQSLYRLLTLPAAGAASSNEIATVSAPTAVTGGEVKSFITAHDWAPDGTYVTYVRAYYFDPEGDVAPSIICGNVGAEACGTQAGPNVYLQRIDTATGQVSGAPLLVAENATLPSVSPDGRYVAYIQGQRLYVRGINADGTLSSAAPTVLTPTTLKVQTGLGNDHRPRWQPR